MTVLKRGRMDELLQLEGDERKKRPTLKGDSVVDSKLNNEDIMNDIGAKDERQGDDLIIQTTNDSFACNIVLYNVEGYLYRDCYTENVATVQHYFNLTNEYKRKGPRGGVAVPFPVRLYEMLSATNDSSYLRSVISWQPHGRCFRIHDIERFSDEIMPR